MQHRCATLLGFGMMLIGTTAAAQSPSVDLQVPSRRMELGEAMTVQLVCTDTAAPQLPELAADDGLDVQLVSSMPSSSSMTQIINGRVTRQSTFTYTLRVTATKRGVHTLGPFTVRAGGQTYQTDPVRITVARTDLAAGGKGNGYLFVELDVTPRELYVTQSYVATLTFGIRKVEIDGRTVNVDMLRSVLDVGASQLSVFANGRAQRSQRWLADANGQRHRFEVFRVTKSIRAETVGDVAVGPVFLKANYPTAVRRGFFGSLDVAAARREFARADAITVRIKEPPLDGRPPDYNGAIGHFALDVTAKPTQVEQGRPITLTVAITGSPREGVAGPKLNANPELISRFDFSKDELVGDLEGNAKVFRRALFPKQPGDQTIPKIAWSYFDPKAERYVTLTSDPIAISVVPAGTNETVSLPEGMGTDERETDLTVLTGGLSPNFVDPGTVLVAQQPALTASSTATLVLLPPAWLAVTLITRRRRRLLTDADLARRSRARRDAIDRIERALRIGDSVEQINALADALTRFVSDRFGLGTGALTPVEIRAALTQHEIDGPLVSDVTAFLEKCDRLRYAPGAAAGLSPKREADTVRRWIRSLEKAAP